LLEAVARQRRGLSLAVDPHEQVLSLRPDDVLELLELSLGLPDAHRRGLLEQAFIEVIRHDEYQALAIRIDAQPLRNQLAGLTLMSLAAARSCGVGGENQRGTRETARVESYRERVRAATKYSVSFAAFAQRQTLRVLCE